MRHVTLFVYAITGLGAVIAGFKAEKAFRAMEDSLDWGTAGKTPWESMFRNVPREYPQTQGGELLNTHKRWNLLTILFGVLLVIEVIAFQR